jgi:hypothetical protein
LELEQQQDEQQQQQSLPAIGAACQTSPLPAAAGLPTGYPSPMVIPAPGLPGMFMYATMPQQACQVPAGTPLTPRQWAALLMQQAGGAQAQPTMITRGSKWLDPAFGTICLDEQERRPLLVPRTQSGLPGAVDPANETGKSQQGPANQKRKWTAGGRRTGSRGRGPLTRSGSATALQAGG